MKIKYIRLGLIMTLFFCFNSSFASNTNATEMFKKISAPNSDDPSCASEPIVSDPNPLLTERLIQMGLKLGISAETDWRWMNVIQKMNVSPSDEPVLVGLIKKGEASKFDNSTRMGNCFIQMKGTLTTELNKDNKEVIALDRVTNFRVVGTDANCNCELDKLNCAKVIYDKKTLCRRVITQSSADPGITKSTISSDFLKDLRSEARQAQINQSCK